MVRRPAFGIFLCLVIGVLINDYLEVEIAILALVLMTSVVLLLSKAINIRLDVIVSIILLIVFGFVIRMIHVNSLEIPSYRVGEIVTLHGEVYGIDCLENQDYLFVVSKVAVNNDVKRVNEKYKLKIDKRSNTNYNGKSISLNIKQRREKGESNPGDFDYKSYLNSRGYIGSIFIKDENINLSEGVNRNPRFYIENLRKWIYINLAETLPKQEANLLFGIILGDTSFMDKDVKSGFVSAGIAHILAMSGLHFGIVYLWMLKIKDFLKVKGQHWRIVCIALLWIIALLNGLKPSALRAVMMLTMMLMASVFKRRYDVLNIAALIGIFTIIYRSDYIYQSGFQLSYIAVLSIVFISPWLKRRSNIKDNELWDAFLVILAVQIGMWPVLAYHFNYHSIVGYLLNVPAVYLTGILLPLGVFHLCIVNIFSSLGMVTRPLIIFLIKALIQCSRFLDYSSLQGLYLTSPNIRYMLIYFSLLSIIVWYDQWVRYLVNQREWFIKPVIVSLMIMLLMSSGIQKDLELLFFDVGQGDSVLVKYNDMRILFDTGETKEDIYLKLLKNGTKELDYLVLSHGHSDHSGGAMDLINKLKVKNVVIGAFYEKDEIIKNIIETSKRNNINIIFMNKGDVIKISKDITLNCLYPEFEVFHMENKVNDSSMVIELKYKDFNCLFTGDIELVGEGSLVSAMGKNDVEVLKVPHHGSDSSSSMELIKAVTPEIAIIQVGINRYGHPNDDIIGRYKNMDVDLYRTDYHGAIKILTDGKRIKATTYLED